MRSLTKTQIREVAKELIGSELFWMHEATRNGVREAAANNDEEEELIAAEVKKQIKRIETFLGKPIQDQSAREEAEARIYEDN
jgi:hypothetical protein